MCAWEDEFLRRVTEAREEEVKELRRFVYMRAVIIITWVRREGGREGGREERREGQEGALMRRTLDESPDVTSVTQTCTVTLRSFMLLPSLPPSLPH